MSWSVSFSNLSLDEIDNLEVDDTQLQGGLARNAFSEARDALVELIQTGICGSPTEYKFSGYLNGHANENNKALPGWSPDCLTLHFAQVRPQSDLDKAANAGS